MQWVRWLQTCQLQLQLQRVTQKSKIEGKEQA